nr:zinc finger, CCHC-type [Tanacetum cinerariifolium]
MAKFKGLGETLKDKVLVRKLLKSAPKKFLPIVATIEQYQDLDEMSFEEVVGRLTAYEERIKSQDTLEANDKLLMASSNNKSYVLTLPVSTASVERAFSAMKIVKDRLRNRMGDVFISDNLVLYIEKDIAETFSLDGVLDDFSAKNRRVRLK